jgi:twitching motility protein PilJ
MTNLKDISDTQSSQSKAGNGKNEHSSAEESSPITVNLASSASSAWSQSKGNRLQNRLLLGILPTVLIPLGVAGFLGFKTVERNIEQEYQSRLERQTLIAGEDMSEFISDTFATLEIVADNPLVIEAVRDGESQVVAENLNALTVKELEQQFNETRVLNLNTSLNNYLQQVANSKGLTEIVVTEKNGFNVAYSQLTSDFVQRGEPWWQNGKNRGQLVGELQTTGELQLDDSTTPQLPVVQSIQDPNTDEFLGVIKIGISTSSLETLEKTLEHSGILPTGQVQVLNTSNNQVLVTVGAEGERIDEDIKVVGENTIGGERVEAFAAAMVENQEASETSREESLSAIASAYNFNDMALTEHSHSEMHQEHEGSHSGEESDHNHEEQKEAHSEKEGIIQASFLYEGRRYKLATVPETDWVAISSVDEAVLLDAGIELVNVFVLTGVILAVVAAGVALILARQLSSPLTKVTESAQKAAAGDLSVRAQPQGTVETETLAKSFNNLVKGLQQLLQEQEATTEQQRKQREELETEVFQLMNDIEQASDGDLTVRAQLREGDIGIVADLFNAVVENLQEIAQQVKDSASRVSHSLGENEIAIRKVSEEAIAEAEQIQNTLNSVEAMNRSIQEVADNSQKAASIADTAFNTAQQGNQAMDQTVERIQELRSTVGETAKKMKHLGESAQKISQVVSLIDEISLKTSLLAINASVEANRAGEMGQGFTAVAEQVESLAEQSASAAKEISQIVSEIQSETQEAIEAMEQGTSEVVESTRSVEETKSRLADVVARSEEINTLMQSISNSTVSQAETSQAVSRLMEQVTQSSQERSQTSGEVAEAIQETAEIAKRLEASVEQFKVSKN